MRLNKIICPKCNASLMSKAGVEVGTALACPKCKLKFKAAAPEEEVDDEEETPKKPARPAMKKRVEDEEDEEEKKPPPKRRVVKDEDEEEEKPRPKKRRQDDEDADRPQAKKRKREDDDDERPRKKKKKSRREDEELSLYGKLKGNIWVRASVLGVLITVLGIVAYLRLIKNQEEEAAIPGPAPNQKEEDYSKPITKEQLGKFPKVDKNPVGKAPQDNKKQVDGDMEKLKGTWKMVDVHDGENSNELIVPADIVWGFRMNDILKINQVFLSSKPSLISKLVIDSSKSPAEIDITFPDNNQTNRGIYRFIDNDTLEISIRIGGGERPKDFSGNKDKNVFTYKLKRGAE